MTTEQNVQADVNVEAEATDQELMEQVAVYQEAAGLYNEGKTEEAVALIREKLGEDAAEDALKVIAQVEADSDKGDAEAPEEE